MNDLVAPQANKNVYILYMYMLTLCKKRKAAMYLTDVFHPLLAAALAPIERP